MKPDDPVSPSCRPTQVKPELLAQHSHFLRLLTALDRVRPSFEMSSLRLRCVRHDLLHYGAMFERDSVRLMSHDLIMAGDTLHELARCNMAAGFFAILLIGKWITACSGIINLQRGFFLLPYPACISRTSSITAAKHVLPLSLMPSHAPHYQRRQHAPIVVVLP